MSLDNLIEIFREEVDVNLREATRLTLELEQGGGERETLEALMRVFHTLKGAARAIGFEEEKRAAHRLEDVFHDLLDGRAPFNSGTADLALAGVDLIRAMLEARLDASPTPGTDDLERRIDDWRAGRGPDPVTPERPAGREVPASAPVAEPEPERELPAELSAGIPDGGIDIASIFRIQVEGHLTEAAALLDAMTGSPGDPATVADLRRLFHTLKGAARAIRFDEIRDLAGAIEQILGTAEETGTAPPAHLPGLIRGACDWIQAMLAARAVGSPPLSAGPLLDQIQNFTAGAQVQVPAPPQPVAPAPESPVEEPTLPEPEPGPETIRAYAAPRGVARSAPARANAAVSYEHLDNLQNLGGELTVTVGALGEQRLRLRGLAREIAAIGHQVSRLLSTLQEEEIGREALIEALRPLLPALRNTGGGLEQLTEVQDLTESRFQHLVDALNDQVTRTRLTPLSTLFDDYPRMVRDLGRELGRELELDIRGGDNRIDRSVLEQIRNPLLHLVRNAIDHGIEAPRERRGAGKPAAGRLTISAVQLGAVVRIAVSDDGRGIDPARLRRTVVARGHTTESLWAAMSADEQLQFLFLPGFSTADQVSDTSGRGFGLDIVRTGIEAVGGRVAVHSDPGQGCRFELDVPLTLSLSRCILVQGGRHPLFGAQLCAFGVNEIESVRRVAAQDLREVHGRMAVRVEGETLYLHELSTALGLEPAHQELARKHLLVLRHGDERFGLLVDGVVDEQDLVTRGLDERLGKVQEVSGITQLSDGRLALILDVPDLLQRMAEGSGGLGSSAVSRVLTGGAEADGAGVPHILVVEDSVTVREVERHFLEQAGYEVSTAVNGMDGFNKAKGGEHDMVITDIDMPRMNGIEMIRQLRAMDRFKSLPIIVVSYKDRTEDRERALEAGADRYVTKSEFDTEVMLELVSELLQREPA